MTQNIKEEVITIIDEYTQELIGDTPVSSQLNAVMGGKSNINHTHNEYALREEYDALKAQVDKLTELIGDVSVSEQISAALKK